jgi:hypothetical protein
MGTENPRCYDRILPVWLTRSVPVATSSEKGSFLLLVKPTEQLLEARIGLNLLDCIEFVTQFVVRPGLVDEVLAGMAGRGNVSSAFAPRHDVVPSGGHLPVTKCASFVHTVSPIFLHKGIHSFP